MPMARASSTRRTPRGIIQSSRLGTIESFGKRVLRDFERWLLADRIYGLGDEPLVYEESLSRLYIIAILRLTGRTVSKLAELARKLGMICKEEPDLSLFRFRARTGKEPLAS